MDIVERLLAQYWEAKANLLRQNYKEATNEIERLRDALTWIERHPVEESKQWEVAVKEMKRLARSALPQKESD